MVKGEAADCASGVWSHSGKGGELGSLSGELTVKFLEDGLRGFLQVTNAVVVAEAFPSAENFFFGGVGDALDGGKLGEEFFEPPVGENRGDGRLLKHDFRNEDGPRVSGFTPRMGFAIFAEPLEESGSEGADVIEWVASGAGFIHISSTFERR